MTGLTSTNKNRIHTQSYQRKQLDLYGVAFSLKTLCVCCYGFNPEASTKILAGMASPCMSGMVFCLGSFNESFASSGSTVSLGSLSKAFVFETHSNPILEKQLLMTCSDIYPLAIEGLGLPINEKMCFSSPQYSRRLDLERAHTVSQRQS